MRMAACALGLLLFTSAVSLTAQSKEDAGWRAALERLDRRDASIPEVELKTRDRRRIPLERRWQYLLGDVPLEESQFPESARDNSWERAYVGSFQNGRWVVDQDRWTRYMWRQPLQAWRLRDRPAFPLSREGAWAPSTLESVWKRFAIKLAKNDGAPSEETRSIAYLLLRLGLQGRFDDDAETRSVAVESARSQLGTKGPLIAAMMARLLGRIGGTDAVGPLVATYLERDERTVRVNCLRALGALGDRGGLVAVAAGMKSGDPHLQRTALEALDAIAGKNELAEKERRGLTAFVWALLTRDPVLDVRRAAVKPLARLSPKSFRLFLTRARQHEPWALRAEAARALGREKKLDWLWIDRFLADPDRRVAGGAVEGLSARVEDAEVQRRLWAVLEKGSDDVQLELALTALAGKLATSAGPETDAADNLRGRLWRAVERVYATLPPSQAESKQACLKAARLLDDARSRRFLDRVAKSDSEYAIRNFARRHLLELGVPESEIPPAQLAAEHPPEIRDLAWDFQRGKGPKEAVIVTEKGEVVIAFEGKDAPFTCAVFATLARRGFYDGLLFHRVIPDFVAQAGCPRGDGWGGPGFSQRCEINGLEYRRGTVGMALAGQDTGGSQFFICFQPQPHLDGRYTIFARVTEGFDVLDALTQGARIDTITVD